MDCWMGCHFHDWIDYNGVAFSIGHLHDGVILLIWPEYFRVLLSCANKGFCYLKLAGITKFQYEKKNEKNSGRSSWMTPLGKWPLELLEWGHTCLDFFG